MSWKIGDFTLIDTGSGYQVRRVESKTYGGWQLSNGNYSTAYPEAAMHVCPKTIVDKFKKDHYPEPTNTEGDT